MLRQNATTNIQRVYTRVIKTESLLYDRLRLFYLKKVSRLTEIPCRILSDRGGWEGGLGETGREAVEHATDGLVAGGFAPYGRVSVRWVDAVCNVRPLVRPPGSAAPILHSPI
jgi:hypothetical protein